MFLEEGGRKPGLGVSKATCSRVAKKIGFYCSFSGVGFCCQHAAAAVEFSARPSFQQTVVGHLLCASLSLTKPTPAASHPARRERAAARWRSAPAHRPSQGGRGLRLRGRSGRRRGSRRRLCDFGFDLPGDELIRLYNRLRGDRKMAARYLRRHGDHRARAGRGPGKIQPLWWRVSLTARTWGGGLGSVAPAANPWQRGPRASTRTPVRSQTTQPLARYHSPALPDRVFSCLLVTGNVQPGVFTTQAQAGLKTTFCFAHLSAHPVVLGTHCLTDPYRFQKARDTGTDVCYCAHPAASETPCEVRPAT